MTTEPENPQEAGPDVDAELESQFEALRAKRAGGDAEPTPEAGASDAGQAEPQATAEASEAAPESKKPLTDNGQSSKTQFEELQAELRRYREESEAAKQEALRYRNSLQAFQRKAAELERQQRAYIGKEGKPTPAVQPADGPSADISALLNSPDLKRTLADFPEVKPLVDVIQKMGGSLSQKIAAYEELSQHLARRLDEEVLPGVSTLASEWEESRFRAKVDDLTSAFPDWNKHYAVKLIPSVDPETGEPVQLPVDARMSPQFASWIFQQPPEVQAMRFSDDPAQVKRMWAKFAQDTSTAAPTSAALSQERTQRLASSAAPAVRSAPAPARVNFDEMSPEEQFAFLRKQRLAQRRG